MWEQGVRKPLTEVTNRHEWKIAHGYRKFYKSRAEQIMKPINVEITMGHDIVISSSYYKPTECEVLDDYVKAIPLLTIHGNSSILQKQVEELAERTNNNDYLLKAKLQEKDDALVTAMKSLYSLYVFCINLPDLADRVFLSSLLYIVPVSFASFTSFETPSS